MYLLASFIGVALTAGTVRAQSDTAHVVITFAAPGDDGGVGRAAAYEVRYSLNSISQFNWNQATPVQETLPAPKSAGLGESISVSVPDAIRGATYYVALRARDEAFNWSPVSNSASFVYGEEPIPADAVVRVK